MAMASSSLCSIFYLLSLLSLFLPFVYSSSSSSSTAITISLTHFHPKNPLPDPYLELSRLASTSRSRAHHLKSPPSAPPATTSTPLSPHSYGGYSISLSFGTPPQTIPFVMDTGSDFVWFPCTPRYICRSCSSDAAADRPPTIPSFIPKQSSSSRILGCLNPKCGLVHSNPNVQSRCQDCEPNSRNCTQQCPPYIILYGSGSTGGITLLETLNLPGKKMVGFVVGCSLFSSHQPAGIAAFGRGPASLPSQMGLKKFSYCLLSHRFDNADESSSMVLDSGSDSGDKKTGNLSYTKFIKNPVVAGKHSLSVFYYVGLKKITVGSRSVKIPYKYFSPGSDGAGGTIVDSGTTFTYMTPNVFELVSREFIEEMKEFKRVKGVELRTGLRPCFNVSGRKNLKLPEMKFHFKGGAEMALPPANYFSIAGETDAVCLTLVTDGGEGPATSGGPAIILGNFQMQNIYTEFDLENGRFGFRRQSCK